MWAEGIMWFTFFRICEHHVNSEVAIPGAILTTQSHLLVPLWNQARIYSVAVCCCCLMKYCHQPHILLETAWTQTIPGDASEKAASSHGILSHNLTSGMAAGLSRWTRQNNGSASTKLSWTESVALPKKKPASPLEIRSLRRNSNIENFRLFKHDSLMQIKPFLKKKLSLHLVSPPICAGFFTPKIQVQIDIHHKHRLPPQCLL